ncbi:MAG: DoxX family protein [Gemmatimonadota bacterium]
MSTLSKPATVISWVAQLAALVILAMAGVMKLSGAPDSVALFETLGAEPFGRYAVGSFEVIAVLLLIRPATAAWGGLLAIGIMVGAIGTHLFKIGIAYPGDGSLFMMAIVVFLAAAIVTWLRRGQLPIAR